MFFDDIFLIVSTLKHVSFRSYIMVELKHCFFFYLRSTVFVIKTCMTDRSEGYNNNLLLQISW